MPSQQLSLPNLSGPSQKKNSPAVQGTAAIALLIFALLFFGLPFSLINRDSQEILLLPSDPREFSRRIERYLVADKNPEIVILGSSTSILPSFLCDRPFWFRQGSGLTSAEDFRHRFNDIVPRYFVAELGKFGYANTSAANLSMPTADVTDEKLVLEKLLRFGKRPKTGVLCVSVRDFAVYPWVGSKVNVSPTFLALNELDISHEAFAKNRIVRFLSAGLPQRTLVRRWKDNKLLFTASLSKLLQPAEQWAKRSCIFPQNYPEYLEPHNIVTSDIRTLMKNTPTAHKFETVPMTNLLSQGNTEFERGEEASLEEIASILKKRGIKLVIAETPLNPGVKPPEKLKTLFRKTIDKVVTHYGANLCPTPEFSENDYLDSTHLDYSGGQKFFHNLAQYITKECP